MPQATLVVSLIFALGMPLPAVDSGQEVNGLEPVVEAPQCVEAQEESPLPEPLYLGDELFTGSIRLCTEEEAANCPTGCGCLFINGAPCCVGIQPWCALTC